MIIICDRKSTASRNVFVAIECVDVTTRDAAAGAGTYKLLSLRSSDTPNKTKKIVLRSLGKRPLPEDRQSTLEDITERDSIRDSGSEKSINVLQPAPTPTPNLPLS